LPCRARSPARTAAGAPAGQHSDDPATASPADPLDPISASSIRSSQLHFSLERCDDRLNPPNTLVLITLKGAPQPWPTIENVIVGPVIAVLSFVCSVGNVPLAAVLWSGGISFGGVLAFLFADLIVLPIVAIYRKYYGNAFALRITALMFATMVIAALVIDVAFSGAGLVPTIRPTRGDVFGQLHVDYKLFLNALGVAIFAALFWLTARRGATDPVCGMKVDHSKASSSDRRADSRV